MYKQIYKMWRKWFMLAMYCALVFSNGYVFSAVSVIPDEAEDYYGVTEDEMNLFMEIFYILYVPVAPLSSWLLTKSLHKSLIIGWVLTALGCWVKLAGGDNFWIALTGQAILCLPTPIILTSVSTVTSMWFPPEQQLLALTIGELFVFIGMGVSLIVAPVISIKLNTLIQSACITAFTVVYLAIARNDPTTSERLSFKEFLKLVAALFRNKGQFSLVMVVSYITGLSYSFSGVLGEALGDEGITPMNASFIGFTLLIMGMMGGLFVAWLEHREVSLLVSTPIMSGALVLVLVLWSVFAQNFEASIVLGGATGFFYFGLVPLGLRICVLFNRSLPDSIPSGTIFLIVQPWALVLTYPLTTARSFDMHAIWLMLILFTIGGIVLVTLLFTVYARNEAQQSSITDTLIVLQAPPQESTEVEQKT